MKTLLTILAGLGFAVVLGVGITWYAFSRGSDLSYGQEIIATFDTPDGPVTARGLSHINYTPRSKILHGDIGNPSIKVSGNAAYGELGGKPVFLLLEYAAGTWAQTVMYKAFGSMDELDQIRSFKEAKDALPLPERRYPRIVTFDDMADPSSVQIVPLDKLSEVFGEGISLRDVALRSSFVPLDTSKMRAMLPWLGQYPEPRLCKRNPDRDATIPDCRHMSHGHFVMGRPEK
ncbi:MAG: hypothetical protein AAGD04_13545 [Pseudomonadota bacterium]